MFRFEAAHPMYTPWKMYQGKYPNPTAHEFLMIEEFLQTFDYEDADFVESDEWRKFEKESGFPNFRQKLLEHLHVIRESKGYDVEHNFGFFDPFAAFEDEQHIRESKVAREVAIATINSRMMQSGKRYEFVKLDKCVWIFPRLTYLMTLTVKEVDGDDDVPDADALIIVRPSELFEQWCFPFWKRSSSLSGSLNIKSCCSLSYRIL